MRKLLLLCLFIHFLGSAQNEQILFDFAGLPQTLLLNPGAELTNQFFVGIPGVSHVYASGGFSEFSVYDVFADDGEDINDKIRRAIANYGKKGLLIMNERIDLISAGFRLKNNSYLSFGMYQEADLLLKIPRDLIDLFYEGNSNIYRHYGIKKLAGRADLIGVFHLGLSKKVNKQLQLGARVKIYSASLNMYSKGNTGELFTTIGTDNLYKQHLNDIDFLVQSSGLFFEQDEGPEAADIQKDLLLGGDLGLGVDIGFTYYPKKQWTISGSVSDIGFINHKKEIKSYKLKGDFEVEGLQLLYDASNHGDYWNDLDEEFKNSVEHETLEDAYTSTRPVKFNLSGNYGFGRPYYDDCRYLIEREQYNNKIGMHMFTTVGTVHSYFAGTLFFEKRMSGNLYGKLTYTADLFSWANIGLGIATKLGPFNGYVTLDNLLGLDNIYDARSMSVSLGFNLIFNH